jgi:hypothetical protein
MIIEVGICTVLFFIGNRITAAVENLTVSEAEQVMAEGAAARALKAKDQELFQYLRTQEIERRLTNEPGPLTVDTFTAHLSGAEQEALQAEITAGRCESLQARAYSHLLAKAGKGGRHDA